MLTNFYNVSKYIKDNNQKVAALFREVRLLFMIIFVCPLYKSSYPDICILCFVSGASLFNENASTGASLSVTHPTLPD